MGIVVKRTQPALRRFVAGGLCGKVSVTIVP
jgi:hypothetical protein